MSQLRRDAISSAGDSQEFSKLTWEEFVSLVVSLTVRAYQNMRRDCPVRRDWEENAFTLNLAHNYIHPLAFDENLPIRLSVRSKIHTRQMESGEQATIEAKEIDLLLYDVWEREYHTVHFVWEAKRVGDKELESRYSNLNSEYVNEAIYRFINHEYADGLDDAGILGYVLDGDPAKIVRDINESMGRLQRNTPLPEADHLYSVESIDQFKDIFRSRHARTDNSTFQLHHLFLTFDFPPVPSL